MGTGPDFSYLVSFKYQLSNELSYNFMLCLVFQSIQCNKKVPLKKNDVIAKTVENDFS